MLFVISHQVIESCNVLQVFLNYVLRRCCRDSGDEWQDGRGQPKGGVEVR